MVTVQFSLGFRALEGFDNGLQNTRGHKGCRLFYSAWGLVLGH